MSKVDDDDDDERIEETLVDDDDDDVDDEEVSLGFAVDRSDAPAALLRNHFPSKLGGAPAWLDPVMLPLTSELRCASSGAPLRFLMQLYAPINDDPRAFHRALYLFISPRGSALGMPGAVRAFRTQLPRANEYYGFDPPQENELPAQLSGASAAIALRRNAAFAQTTAAQHTDDEQVAGESRLSAVVDVSDDGGAAHAMSRASLSPGSFAGYHEWVASKIEQSAHLHWLAAICFQCGGRCL
jgi:hypothetical protein